MIFIPGRRETLPGRALAALSVSVFVFVSFYFATRSSPQDLGPAPEKVETRKDTGNFRIVLFGLSNDPSSTALAKTIGVLNGELDGELRTETVYLDRNPERRQEAQEAGIGLTFPFLVVYDDTNYVAAAWSGPLDLGGLKALLVRAGVLRKAGGTDTDG